MTEGEEITIQQVAIFILSADERELNIIREATKARHTAMREERRLTMLSNIYVGTRILLNGQVSPKMLQWQSGAVERIDSEGIYAIRLDNPPSDKWRGLVSCTLDQFEVR